MFEQGNTEDQCFYMIVKGSVEVWSRDEMKSLNSLRAKPQTLFLKYNQGSSPTKNQMNRGPSISGMNFSPNISPTHSNKSTRKQFFQLDLAPINTDLDTKKDIGSYEMEEDNIKKSYSISSNFQKKESRQSSESEIKESVEIAKDGLSNHERSEAENSAIKVKSERKAKLAINIGSPIKNTKFKVNNIVLRRADSSSLNSMITDNKKTSMEIDILRLKKAKNETKGFDRNNIQTQGIHSIAVDSSQKEGEDDNTHGEEIDKIEEITPEKHLSMIEKADKYGVLLRRIEKVIFIQDRAMTLEILL